MKLVMVVHIKLCRLQSALRGGFAAASAPKSGVFVIGDKDMGTLKEAVLDFAEQCGVGRAQLQGLKLVSNHQPANESKVITFDIDTPGTQYGTPYATCEACPALKVGDRYFKLSEISNVGVF